MRPVRSAFRPPRSAFLALAFGAMVSAGSAEAEDRAPFPFERAELVRRLTAADGAEVQSLGAFFVGPPGRLRDGWRRPAEALAQDSVDRAWLARFRELLLRAEYRRFERCSPPRLSNAPFRPGPVARVLVPDAKHDTLSVTLDFGEECAAIGSNAGPGGCIRFGPVARELRALVAARIALDTPGPPRVAADSAVRAESVYVDELPEAVDRAAPEYPAEARRAGVDGTVRVQALVGKTGEILDAFVLESPPMLDAAAIAAVRKWRFKPAKASGRPIMVWVTIPVNFVLH